jgi:hypothetical protein
VETLEEAVRKCEKSAGKCRSFFAKRLEQHLSEKGIAIPERIFSLFDTPFSAFTPECIVMYEQKIKGQALFQIFSDMLVEIYQRLDAEKSGWETAANYLEDTPMRICALHAMKRIDQLEQMPESDYLYMVEQFSGLSAVGITPKDQKFGARPYAGMGKSRWWKREEPRLVSSGKN